jgi:hypothetical protein
MDTTYQSLEGLVRAIIDVRSEYSNQSREYIQKAQTLLVKFKETQDDAYMQDIRDIHQEHKKFTQNYRKKVKILNKKISDSLKNIA